MLNNLLSSVPKESAAGASGKRGERDAGKDTKRAGSRFNIGTKWNPSLPAPLQSNWTSSDTWVFWMCLNASFSLFLCAAGFIIILMTRRFRKSDEFSRRKVVLFKI